MGISGLIPFLEKASARVHLRELRGSTVAVDTYCWLHGGVYTCAEKLARGEETDLYVQFCLRYVRLLLAFDIKPILVFDGRHLPAKMLTENRRRESRQQSKKLAAELLRLGRIDEARSHMRRSVDVTHKMALALIRECRKRNVDCIVAPYEADAQMAWLNRANLAQYIITEDSDLTLFGASRIIFKLDMTGNGLLVVADKLHLAMGVSEERYSFEKFRRMCILSGCDYLDSLKGIGLAKACKFFLKTEEDDMWRALKKIPVYLNMRHLVVDDEYIEGFLKAEATFKHMYIFNPLKRRMERLNELENTDDDPERYCGNAGTLLEDQEQALQLALGNLDPFTLKRLDSWHPDRDFGNSPPTNKNLKRAKHSSIWKGNFQSYHDKDPPDTEKKQTSCALYFKKVNFNSHSIDEEVSANMRAESAKPEEEDIFSMYQQEVDGSPLKEPSVKCRRYESGASSSSVSLVDEIDSTTQVPPSPTEAIATRRHNPFASKVLHAADDDDSDTAEKLLRKPQAICKNSSLLKVLSPKKSRSNTVMPAVVRLNSLKRSIFSTASIENSPPLVEVKSRFFATNLKHITKTKIPTPTLDLTEEIDEIDSLSQQTQENIAQLYHSPSPKKPVWPLKNEERTLICADSATASLPKGDDLELTTVEKETSSDCESSADLENNVKNVRTTEITAEETAIVLSDDDDEDESNFKSNSAATFLAAIKSSPQLINAFKRQTAPRLGLSKPSRTNSKNTKKKNTKSSKSAASSSSTASALGQNQTRLSMFGFQKRPTLQ